MSDLKIVNGRVGRDKSIGKFTCHTCNGKSTIDYVIASMSMFPKFVDFHIDILDKCMSDVHCPVCVFIASDINSCTMSETSNDNVDNSKYSFMCSI